MTKLHMRRKAGNIGKVVSHRVLTSPLMSPQPSRLYIEIFLFIIKDFTQKWSQIFLYTGVVTTNYSIKT